MAFNQSNFPQVPCILGPIGAVASASNAVMNDALVFLASGDAYGIHFCAPFTDTLTDVYLYCNAALVGAPVVIGAVYESNAAAARPANPAVGNIITATNVVQDQWMRFTGLAASLTPGKQYWFIVGNTEALTTAQIQASARIQVSPQGGTFDCFEDRQSTNGGTTMSQLVTTTKALAVFKFEDNGVWGCPYNSSSTYSGGDTTLEKGNRITGIGTDIEVVGAVLGAAASEASAFKIYSSASGPGSATILNLSLSGNEFTSAADLLDFYFDPVVLPAGGTYVMSLTFGSASFGPERWSIPDFDRYADVQSCAYGGLGNYYQVIDNGAGGWTGDTSVVCKIGLLVNPLQSSVVGGGGGTYSPARPPARPAPRARPFSCN